MLAGKSPQTSHGLQAVAHVGVPLTGAHLTRLEVLWPHIVGSGCFEAGKPNLDVWVQLSEVDEHVQLASFIVVLGFSGS